MRVESFFDMPLSDPSVVCPLIPGEPNVIVGERARAIPVRLGWGLHKGLRWGWECVPRGVYGFLAQRDSV